MYDDDLCITSHKKGGGGRKQHREKLRTDKTNNNNSPTCYSSKHIRKVEALMAVKNTKTMIPTQDK
jgi:hypothetical protein